MIGATWTFADLLVLAAILTREDLQSFQVRRILQRIESGEVDPREAALILNRDVETAADR